MSFRQSDCKERRGIHSRYLAVQLNSKYTLEILTSLSLLRMTDRKCHSKWAWKIKLKREKHPNRVIPSEGGTTDEESTVHIFSYSDINIV